MQPKNKFELGITETNQLIISPKPIYCFIQIIHLWLFSLGLTIAAFFYFPLSLIGLVFSLLSLYKYLYMKSIKYIFKEETLSVRTGVLNLTLNTLELFRVKDLTVKQYFWMRFFKIMSLNIHTTENGGETITLKGIPQSNLILEKLRNSINNSRIKNKIVELA